MTEKKLAMVMVRSKEIIENSDDPIIVAKYFEAGERIGDRLNMVGHKTEIIPLSEVMRSINEMTANL